MLPPPTRAARAARRRRLAPWRTAGSALVAVIIVIALVVGVVGFVHSLSQPRTSADATPAASARLSAPVAEPTFDVVTAADAAMLVLADYSDAARATEDALYAAAEELRNATTAEEADAAAATTDAAAVAVRADAEAYRAQLAAASAATATQPAGGDVSAQMAYLHQYVFAYNSTVWGDYNDYGGDCTNFASQGLIARGWHIDDVWYSDGEMWTASDPWIVTTDMADYFDSLGLTYSTEADLDRVRVGDIGLFSWGETDTVMDHTMTVSKVEYVPGGAAKVSFIGHNVDAEYRELTTVLYSDHQDSTVRIYHIP